MKLAWLALCLIPLLIACQGELPTATPLAPTIVGRPIQVIETTHTALLRNPAAFENQFIRLSGLFEPLPVLVCNSDAHRPPAGWLLIEGPLEVQAAGFDQALRSLGSESLALTIEGRWLKWTGPVGCGRRTPTVNIWYLQAVNVLSPNPLSAEVLADLPGDDAGSQQVSSPAPPVVSIPPQVTQAPAATQTMPPIQGQGSPVSSPSPTASRAIESSATATALITREATPTASSQIPPSISPTASATPLASDVTPSVTPSMTPSSTPTVAPGGGSLDWDRFERDSIAANGVHDWIISIDGDEIVTFSAGPVPGLDLVMELIGPDEATLSTQNGAGAGQGESIYQLAVEQSGQYVVRISTVGSSSGNYSLIATSSQSEAYVVYREVLTYGTVGTGSLPDLTDHAWDFFAESGDNVTIVASPVDGRDLVLFLYAPDSGELAYVDENGAGQNETIANFAITESGTYTVRVGELDFLSTSYTVTVTKD